MNEADQTPKHGALLQKHLHLVLARHALGGEQKPEHLQCLLAQQDRISGVEEERVEKFAHVGFEKEEEDLVAFGVWFKERAKEVEHFANLNRTSSTVSKLMS